MKRKWRQEAVRRKSSHKHTELQGQQSSSLEDNEEEDEAKYLKPDKQRLAKLGCDLILEKKIFCFCLKLTIKIVVKWT